MKNKPAFAVAVTGFSGIAAQVILLRELLVTYSGNEMTIGLILSAWLIAEASGAFSAGRRLERSPRKLGYFIALTLLFSVILPVSVYYSRFIRTAVGAAPGEGLGLAAVAVSSLILVFPAGFLHGALFPAGCGLYSRFRVKAAEENSRQDIISRVYVMEIAGTVSGGVLVTYLLIPYMNSFEAALAVIMLNITALLILAGSRLPFSVSVRRVVFSALLVLVFFPSLKLMRGLNEKSAAFRWPGQNMVYYGDSVYGNLAVTETGGEFTFYSDGVPVISVPFPDTVEIEDFIHLPLLMHPDPGKVLVISGGAGGVINEILRHGVKKIDYAEQDPLVIEKVKEFSAEPGPGELDREPVKLHYRDGRMVVRETERLYDAVFIGFSLPSTLQINRFFTVEFFRQAGKILREDGVLVIRLPGSLSYLSEEMRDLNAALLGSLENVFEYVRVFPGDGLNIFTASRSPDSVLVSARKSRERLDRIEGVKVMSPEYIRYRHREDRAEDFYRSVRGLSAELNRDFSPIGVYLSQRYINSKFSPGTNRFLDFFTGYSPERAYIPGALLIAVFGAAGYFSKKPLDTAVTFCIGSTGFASMIFDLTLLFAFQAVYGYVYYWAGMLIAFFMGGAASGALLARKKIPVAGAFGNLAFLEAGVIIFAAGLYLVLKIPVDDLLSGPAASALIHACFIIAAFCAGGLTGAEFTLASDKFPAGGRGVIRRAGVLYGADLTGGWVGGFLGGAVLFPLLGLPGTLLVAAVLKAMSFLFLLYCGAVNNYRGSAS